MCLIISFKITHLRGKQIAPKAVNCLVVIEVGGANNIPKSQAAKTLRSSIFSSFAFPGTLGPCLSDSFSQLQMLMYNLLVRG